jgi:hypothetical protein
MNNTQLNDQYKQFQKREEFICTFETSIEKMGKEGLEKLTKKLNTLCQSYNPYDNLELSQIEQNIISELNLEHHLDDPFHFTNLVLQMMDKVENKLKQKIH